MFCSSSSSISVSTFDFAFVGSGDDRGGSHEAMRRWDLARATAVRLKMMSASEVMEVGVGAGGID